MVKFRGKRKAGKWIKGDKVEIGKRCWIVSRPELAESDDMREIHCSIFGFVEVTPSTIAQFTGLKDKNQKEIYGSIPIDGVMSEGGDIVKSQQEFVVGNPRCDPHIRKVIWSSKAARFMFQDKCGNRYSPYQDKPFEIIGNQTDDKDLLERKD